MDTSPASLAQAAAWQTGTAVVQALCSVSLLAWYVLAAHLDRRRQRREKAADFEALVNLCRDLGTEAQARTAARHTALAAAATASAPDPAVELALWRADMQVIYVCLNEVPHYEVRNPAFSTALTRLWLEVDGRSLDPAAISDLAQLTAFLSQKAERIGREVEAMARIAGQGRSQRKSQTASHNLGPPAGRRGHAYSADGFMESGPYAGPPRDTA